MKVSQPCKIQTLNGETNVRHLDVARMHKVVNVKVIDHSYTFNGESTAQVISEKKRSLSDHDSVPRMK